MEDAASEIGDWEVLSSASSCGGDDSEDVVVVSGGGGDVLPDHFTLDLASPAVGFSGEGSWSEPEVVCFKEYQREGLEFLDEFNSISQESLDLVAGISSLQLQEGGADENRESSVLEAAAACGANCSAEGRQAEATGLEIEQENNIARSCGKFDLALQPAHHGAGEPLDSDTTTDIHGSPQSEVAENSRVQLEDHIVVDASIETSRIEDTVSSDGIHGGEAEKNQGNDAYAGSGCDETDGEAKDGALPLVQSPGTALLGLVMLGRKMYRMKHKARGMPQIKIAFDDKRTSQYANRAARLNEAFLIARRVPMLRTSSGAVLPWSMVQER
ncbi:hypothetical protein QOZ80_2AG0134260 [Eleusine coracana subsp. coracana]|nr:hypothetical protein QOZ80_2AG0134260 [Eleusine coracana subsp. coracana]